MKSNDESSTTGAGSVSGEPRPVGGPTAIVIGEALVDEFDDGRSVVGGAPLNVAWNLAGFGLSPRFVSALGSDERGDRIFSAMRDWGLGTDGLVRRDDHETGVVRVTLRSGQPSYEIVFPAAYDFIPGPERFAGSGFLPAPADPHAEASAPILYLGTLAWRHRDSRHVLQSWIERFGQRRFVDINIRAPWFDRSLMEPLVRGARYVKLNDDELSELAEHPCESEEEIRQAVSRFRRRYGGDTFFVTCGSRGAYAVTDQELRFSPAPPPEPLRDTVGAGDAFAAATIAALLRGTSPTRCLAAGVRFAARVCTLQGATSTDRTLYQTDWSDHP